MGRNQPGITCVPGTLERLQGLERVWGPTRDPKPEGSGALRQMPGRSTSLEGPLARLHAQQASAGLALGAVWTRVIPHPLGLGPPEALAASVWEIR